MLFDFSCVVVSIQRKLQTRRLAAHDGSSPSCAHLPAALVLGGEEVCVGVCDGFGVAPSLAVAIDVPDDDAIEAVHSGSDTGCVAADSNV